MKALEFGKRQEFIAVAELLRRGLDVYMTLVDDKQIDCVIRVQRGTTLRYVDVQIKARSKGVKLPTTFNAGTIDHPRHDYWFVFYSEEMDRYWLIPSGDLASRVAVVTKQSKKGKIMETVLASVNKRRKNIGKYTVKPARKVNGVWKTYEHFEKYEGENGFKLLLGESRPG